MNIDLEIEKKSKELFYLLQEKAIYGLDSLKIGDTIYGNELYKKKIISQPGRLQSIEYPTIFIQVEVEYKNFKSKEFISLSDRNVINGGYNLHRIFRNRNDAKLYKELVNIFENKISPKKSEIITTDQIMKMPIIG